MKNQIIKHMAGVLLCSTLLLAGCENAEYSVLRNQAYISQTNTSANKAVKVFIDEEAVTQNLNVRLSDPAEQECTFRLVEDAALLAKYNETNYTSYLPLPAGQYSLGSGEVKVKAGEALSESLGLQIQPLTKEMKESGNKYAVALNLQRQTGDAGILAPGSTIIYLMDPAIVTPVPIFSGTNEATLTLPEEQSLAEWTVEFCVNMSRLGQGIGDMNNQAIFDAKSNLGEGDGQIYIRFGDAPIEGNRLQIKTQGTQMNSQMLFEQNKWYHIAFVCAGSKLYLYVDGKLDKSMDTSGKVTNLGKTCKIGNAQYLKADVMMSELRLWSRALPQREVANNPYATNPKAPGLVVYFKFNEGQGKKFADATGNGGDGRFGEERWQPNVRLNANSSQQ